MSELDPFELTTRQEKVFVVVIAFASVLIHVLIIFGTFRHFWPERKEEEQKMMIVRRIPDTSPPDISPSIPPPQSKKVYKREEAVVDKGKPPKPSTENSRSKNDISEDPTTLPPDKPRPKDIKKKDNTISVYTDLNSAFFHIEGPYKFKGAGTFWEKKYAPVGEYQISFGTVEGYQTPPPQTSSLIDGGAVVFVGRYTKMTQITVDTNLDNARYKIIRPDGQYIDLLGNKQGSFKDLPLGKYTIIFESVPGWLPPAPQNKTLLPGSHLNFSGYYRQIETVQVAKTTARQPARGKAPSRKTGKVLDRRIKMLVKSYPVTGIEEYYEPVEYPEVLIQKSNYQEGWCQVYLILRTNRQGEIENYTIERPKVEERTLFAPLIETVLTRVRSWDYDRKRAEIHVDVRFYVEK